MRYLKLAEEHLNTADRYRKRIAREVAARSRCEEYTVKACEAFANYVLLCHGETQHFTDLKDVLEGYREDYVAKSWYESIVSNYEWLKQKGFAAIYKQHTALCDALRQAINDLKSTAKCIADHPLSLEEIVESEGIKTAVETLRPLLPVIFDELGNDAKIDAVKFAVALC